MAIIGFLVCLAFCIAGIVGGSSMFMLGTAFGPSRPTQIIGILAVIVFACLAYVTFQHAPFTISIK